MKLLTAAEMRAVDRRAIEEIGLPIAALMENAGRAVADACLHGPVLVVCGLGNNGGDGLVAARHLANRGLTPTVVLLGRVDDLKSDLVRTHAQAIVRSGIRLIEATDGASLAPLTEPGRFATVVDAIFGTGFRPPATGLAAAAIAAIRGAGASASLVAVDLPSGLDADRGELDGPAVTADVTITFAAAKPAHFLAPAATHCGRVRVVDIGIPRHLVESPDHRLELVSPALVNAALPLRPAEAHKGTFGHLLIVAGSRGKTGAAVLAARAALRAGTGLVTVATPASCVALVANGAPELMTEPLAETSDGTIDQSAVGRIRELLAVRTALAIGPGLGTHPNTQRAVEDLVAGLAAPAVIDADALNALAAAGRSPASAEPTRLVLTPHPGEAGRLLGRATAEINRHRLAAAIELATRWRAVAVLKGRPTVTAGTDGRVVVNTSGNPGLATAGSGDVLTGIIGGLLAQGVAPRRAAIAAVYLHGLAADLAVAIAGEAALIASDVIEHLGRAEVSLRAAAASMSATSATSTTGQPILERR